jgi:hypothetical protein
VVIEVTGLGNAWFLPGVLTAENQRFVLFSAFCEQ